MSNWKKIGTCSNGIFKPSEGYIPVYKNWEAQGLQLGFKYHIVKTCGEWDYLGSEPITIQYLEERGTIQLRIHLDQRIIERQKEAFRRMTPNEFIRRFGVENYRHIKVPLDQK